MIDLRSDTATLPTPGMRDAMAGAQVGDEQRREDPTVRTLEERVASLLGKKRAVFLPTATMANQIALRLSTVPGDELVAEANAHVFRYESGGAAVHSGLSMKAVRTDRGLFGPEAIAPCVNPASPHDPRTRLLALENTHNVGGGTVWPVALFAAVVGEGRRLGLGIHLDGARLFNAAVAAGEPPAAWAAHADTVTVCLSKGLGCPLGALLASSDETIERAWRLKHLFGGALRQSGIVAAAGLYALDNHVERLADDHEHARALADGLARAGWPVSPDRVETNFVQIDCGPAGIDAAEAISALAAEGVLVSSGGRAGVLRAVTHLGIGVAEIEAAVTGGRRAFARLTGATGT